MNSTELFRPTPGVESDQPAETVAIALISFLDPWSWREIHTVRDLFEKGLSAAGIKFEFAGGLRRPLYLVLLFEVADRKAGLRALHEISERNPVLGGLAEIAYMDKAEQYWRSVHPAGAPPFDRFLAPEERQAAIAELATREAAIQVVLQALNHSQQEKGPQE